MDMEISPGDSQEDQDEDDGDVNMDQFISAETMERGEAAIRRERESSRRTEEDEDEVMQPSLDDRLKGDENRNAPSTGVCLCLSVLIYGSLSVTICFD